MESLIVVLVCIIFIYLIKYLFGIKIDDVKKIIQSFEIQFENQFKDIDTSERHVSDLILQFKIKEIER